MSENKKMKSQIKIIGSTNDEKEHFIKSKILEFEAKGWTHKQTDASSIVFERESTSKDRIVANTVVGFLILLTGLFVFNLLSSEKSEPDLIPYKVVKREGTPRIKLSLDVEVGLVNERLPNANEIGAISKFLVSEESSNYENIFVSFYLPRMKPDAGAFATAHHQPEMKVEIMKFMLQQYPEYERFSK